MACGSCGGGGGGGNFQYIWTSVDGNRIVIYPTEIMAKAKVHRAGGTYQKKAVNG